MPTKKKTKAKKSTVHQDASTIALLEALHEVRDAVRELVAVAKERDSQDATTEHEASLASERKYDLGSSFDEPEGKRDAE